jgi:hypothetical protein
MKLYFDTEAEAEARWARQKGDSARIAAVCLVLLLVLIVIALVIRVCHG